MTAEPALPPVLQSMLAPIIAGYAVCNGLPGAVTVAGKSVCYISIAYPSLVEGLKYPPACADPTLAPIDVTWMSDGASVFTAVFAAQLLVGAPLYLEVFAAIEAFMGVAPSVLTFTAPVLKVYKYG